MGRERPPDPRTGWPCCSPSCSGRSSSISSGQRTSIRRTGSSGQAARRTKCRTSAIGRRALWDPDYVDESWIGGTEVGGARVRLIPRLKEWVANHYPGTLIGITEYNWGDVDRINGATAQADILGIFGREDLDIGIRWTTPAVGSFAGNAFRLYRNYNGTGAAFGDMSVSASGPNPDEVSVFASERTPDGALTIMLISKGRTGDTPATINLANFNPGYPIERRQLTSTNIITELPNISAAGNSVSLTLPQQSITLLVIPECGGVEPPLFFARMARVT